MSDWPQIQIDVDDFRDADPRQVERCDYCLRWYLTSELRQHCGEDRCHDCRFWCVDCHDAPVETESSFCEFCAIEGMTGPEGAEKWLDTKAGKAYLRDRHPQ